MNAGGGCLSAVVARMRVGWGKFKELSGVLCGKKWSMKMKGRVLKSCVIRAMVYGSETWAMRRVEENIFRRAERAMVRMMCGVRLRDRKSSRELMSMVGMKEDIAVVVKKSRLRWYGHVLRRSEEDGTKKALELIVPGAVGKGRPRLSWQVEAEKDMVRAGLRRGDARDRGGWRQGVNGLSF